MTTHRTPIAANNRTTVIPEWNTFTDPAKMPNLLIEMTNRAGETVMIPIRYELTEKERRLSRAQQWDLIQNIIFKRDTFAFGTTYSQSVGNISANQKTVRRVLTYFSRKTPVATIWSTEHGVIYKITFPNGWVVKSNPEYTASENHGSKKLHFELSHLQWPGINFDYLIGDRVRFAINATTAFREAAASIDLSKRFA